MHRISPETIFPPIHKTTQVTINKRQRYAEPENTIRLHWYPLFHHEGIMCHSSSSISKQCATDNAEDVCLSPDDTGESVTWQVLFAGSKIQHIRSNNYKTNTMGNGSFETIFLNIARYIKLCWMSLEMFLIPEQEAGQQQCNRKYLPDHLKARNNFIRQNKANMSYFVDVHLTIDIHSIWVVS